MPVIGEPIAQAVVRLSLDDKKYKTGMRTTETDLKKFSEKAQQHTRQIGVALMGIGAGVVAGLGLAVRQFSTFEKSMKNVASVSGATAAEFRQLSDFAREMGATTAFSAKEAADGMYYLASAGLSVQEQMQTTAAVLDLASATQSELAASSQLVVNSLSGFQLEATEARRVADVFAASISSSQANLSKLSVSIPITSASFEQMNWSIEQNVTALSLLYDRGGRAETAATGLRNALKTLLDITPEGTEALRSMGLTIDDVSPKTNSLADIIGNLERANFDVTDSIKIFGKENDTMIKLVAAGSQQFKEFEASMSAAGGTAKKMSDEQLDSLNGSFALMNSALSEMAITIGEVLAPTVRSIAEYVTELTTKFNQLTDHQQSIITWGIAAGGAMTLVGGGLGTIAAVLPGVIAGMTILGPLLFAVAPIAGIFAAVAFQVFSFLKAVKDVTEAFQDYNAGAITTTELTKKMGWEWVKAVSPLVRIVDLLHDSSRGELTKAINELGAALASAKENGLDPTNMSIEELGLSSARLSKQLDRNVESTQNAVALYDEITQTIRITTETTGLMARALEGLNGIIDNSVTQLGNLAAMADQPTLFDHLTDGIIAAGAAMDSTLTEMELGIQRTSADIAAMSALQSAGLMGIWQTETQSYKEELEERETFMGQSMEAETEFRRRGLDSAVQYRRTKDAEEQGLIRAQFDWHLGAWRSHQLDLVKIVQAASAEIAHAQRQALIAEFAAEGGLTAFVENDLAKRRQAYSNYTTFRANNAMLSANEEIAIIDRQYQEQLALTQRFGGDTVELERWRSDQIQEIRLAEIDGFITGFDTQLNAFSSFANAHSRLYGTWLGDLFGMSEDFHETTLSRFGNWVSEQIELLDTLRDAWDSIIDTWNTAMSVIRAIADQFNDDNGGGNAINTAGSVANLLGSGGNGSGGNGGGGNVAGLANLGNQAGIGTAAGGTSVLSQIGSGLGTAGSTVAGLPWGTIAGTAGTVGALAMQAAIVAWIGYGVYKSFTGGFDSYGWTGPSADENRARVAQIRSEGTGVDDDVREASNRLAERNIELRRQQQEEVLRYADSLEHLYVLQRQGNPLAEAQIELLRRLGEGYGDLNNAVGLVLNGQSAWQRSLGRSTAGMVEATTGVYELSDELAGHSLTTALEAASRSQEHFTELVDGGTISATAAAEALSLMGQEAGRATKDPIYASKVLGQMARVEVPFKPSGAAGGSSSLAGIQAEQEKWDAEYKKQRALGEQQDVLWKASRAKEGQIKLNEAQFDLQQKQGMARVEMSAAKTILEQEIEQERWDTEKKKQSALEAEEDVLYKQYKAAQEKVKIDQEKLELLVYAEKAAQDVIWKANRAKEEAVDIRLKEAKLEITNTKAAFDLKQDRLMAAAKLDGILADNEWRQARARQEELDNQLKQVKLERERLELTAEYQAAREIADAKLFGRFRNEATLEAERRVEVILDRNQIAAALADLILPELQSGGYI